MRIAALRGSVASGLLLLTACGKGAPPPEPTSAPPPPEVGVVELETQRVPLSVKLPGRVSAYAVAELRPQVTGILQERLFTQGARVEAGQTLYEIDSRPYRAAVARSEAELARARAAVSSLRVQERRYAALRTDDAVSQQEYDDVKALLDQRLAEVEVARAALEAAEIDLGYTRIAAPIEGVVGPTLVTIGALVTADQEQPLVRVTRLDPIYVDIQRPVSELRRLRAEIERGAPPQGTAPAKARVTVLFDDGARFSHPGTLEVRDVTVNAGTSSVTLRAVVPNPDHELLPGMFVRAVLAEGVREDAILVPQQGITHDPGGQATALIVDDEGKVVQRRLEIARAVGSFWLVEAGLEAGDRLIVTGLQKARPGARVKPVPAAIPTRPDEDGDASGRPAAE
ncbi:MAG: efflux RND transporter periplasmic adaptor subunit [Gammaproteobacteria bacterium]